MLCYPCMYKSVFLSKPGTCVLEETTVFKIMLYEKNLTRKCAGLYCACSLGKPSKIVEKTWFIPFFLLCQAKLICYGTRELIAKKSLKNWIVCKIFYCFRSSSICSVILIPICFKNIFIQSRGSSLSKNFVLVSWDQFL